MGFEFLPFENAMEQSISEHADAIKKLLNFLSNFPITHDEKHKKKIELTIWFFKNITINPIPTRFSECSYCIKNYLGNIWKINNNQPFTGQNLDEAFDIAVKFVKEKFILRNKINNFNIQDQEVEIYSFYSRHDLTPNELYYKIELDTQITHYNILGTVDEIEKKTTLITNKIEKYHETLASWDGKITTYRDELKKTTTNTTLYVYQEHLSTCFKQKRKRYAGKDFF